MRLRQATLQDPRVRRAGPTAFRQSFSFQQTIGRSVSLDGIGVHSAQPSRVTLHPADENTGLVFHRTVFTGSRGDAFIPARADRVVATTLTTRLAALSDPDVSVGAVEHVLAALSALGIDNALIEVDGPEVPILDGSARPFVEAIRAAGIVAQRRPRRVLQILEPVRVEAGEALAEFLPGDHSLTLDVAIDYADPAVGVQRRVFTLDADGFATGIAPARTFGFVADVEALWRAGFAAGSSLDNTIAIADGCILNAEGLRAPDECVRHKILDAIGDLALTGCAIQGTFRSFRGGHSLNHAAVAALLGRRDAWRIEAAAVPSHPATDSRSAIASGL